MNLARLLRTQWDRSAGAALVASGLVSLLLGWLGMSDTVLTFEQMPYLLSGGLLGVALIIVGAALWLSADIRDEWRKIDRLEEAIHQAAGTPVLADVVLPEAHRRDADANGTPESSLRAVRRPQVTT